MRTAPLAVSALLLVAACRSEPSLPLDDSVAIDLPPDTAQHPAADASPLPGQQTLSSDPYAIVPGVRVGQVRLGMPFDSLLVSLGQPSSSDAGVGYAWGAWNGWGAARGSFVDAFAVASSPDAPYLVSQIRVDGPPFHTEGDLPANATRADVLRRYPSAKAVRGLHLYDDRRGIGFAFDRAGDSARAVAMYIVPPGTPVEQFRARPDTP